MKLTFENMLAVYGIIALLTFGYGATNAECKSTLFHNPDKTECRAIKGMMSGGFWPLYWTWAGFEAVRTAPVDSVKSGEDG